MAEHQTEQQNNANELAELLTSNWLGTFFGVSQDVLDRVWANLTAPQGNSVLRVSPSQGQRRNPHVPGKIKPRAEPPDELGPVVQR